jgi:hypothetical protein
MQHEPSTLLSHTDGLGKLIGTDAVLAVGKQPRGRKPLFQTDRRILKDSPYFEGEFLFRMFPIAPIKLGLFEVCYLLRIADRAFHDSIGPTNGQHELTAILSVAKVLNGFD